MSQQLQKAWFYNEYGSIDVLQFGEIPVPKPGPGQLLLKIRAAALNPCDFKEREGLLPKIRAAPLNTVDFKEREGLLPNAGEDSDFPAVPGCDAAGVVVKVGDSYSKFKNGDEVYSNIQNFRTLRPTKWGTLAQYTLVDEYLVAQKPTNLSFEEAASLPLALQTAQGAFDYAKFEKGKSVFIVGGAGGVGSLAIQLARHVYGASRIVSTASTVKLEFVKSLGADLVIDYTKQSYDQISEKFDFVLDTIGDSSKSHVVAKEEARVLDIATIHPHPRVEFFGLSPNGHNLEKLQPYIESGKVKPVIDPKSPYSFSDVIEAFKHLETGGKIVISPIE